MLRRILENPFRLFVILSVMAGAGIWCGLKLPISLYPQTSRPVVRMSVSYGGFSAEEFVRKYGATLEYQLENIKNTGLPLDSVKANYGATSVQYTITYDWRVSAESSLKEVEAVASSAKGILPRESSDSVSVWQWNDNAGFLAVSFYSRKHSLNQLYDVLEPILGPGLKRIPDSKEAVLWNPESQEVSILLVPEKMALYGLLPGEVHRSLEASLPSLTGGSVRLGQKNASFQIPSFLRGAEELENHVIKLANGRQIHLKDVAQVSVGRSEQQSRGFKTNGKESLILFADPKSGANVKRMAEDVLDLIERVEGTFPEGIEYKVLVDPSEFIRASIVNLLKDVALAAALAVLVLFLFIGNFRNVATAALEIPLSMIIAFIVMYFTGMNLNLISLGGLALAAGMNVDASVVVLENIFRHQDEWIKAGKDRMNWGERLELVLRAVNEVRAPVFLSIATTLIVFIPLAMTTDLTNAILGDLAKAVIYSHGVSGFVAVFVVPTIRLFLLKERPVKVVGPLEGRLRSLEEGYVRSLQQAMRFPHSKLLALVLPILLATLSVALIAPRLPKEIIGTPDTDWIYISVNSPQSTSNRQMENIIQEVESRALEEESEAVAYTFVQMHGKTNGSVMLRLKDKKLMKPVVERMQKLFSNTPEVFFWVDSWNPAELPLPTMYHLDLVVTGKNGDDVRNTASRLKYFLQERGDYKRLQATPAGLNEKIHRFVPHLNVWTSLQAENHPLSLGDVLDLTIYAENGKSPGSLLVNGSMTPITLRFGDERFKDPERLAAYPLKLKDKVVPLSALGHFETVSAPTEIYRQDGRELAKITSTLDKGKEGDWEGLAKRYEELISKETSSLTEGKDVVIEMLTPQKELQQSLAQIKTSLLISLGLIFLVLWLQFQSVKQVGIIMVTIPLGLIGAFPALYVFGSTLSLNSALGVLLLNGIAVNNAILLVEVVNHLRSKGLSPNEAVVASCRSRLRPILITSLSTGLGMLPIALGLGEGGKILQPLGITVACGLLFSTTAALFVVPLLLQGHERLSPTTDLSEDPALIIDLLKLRKEKEREEVGPLQ